MINYSKAERAYEYTKLVLFVACVGLYKLGRPMTCKAIGIERCRSDLGFAIDATTATGGSLAGWNIANEVFELGTGYEQFAVDVRRRIAKELAT